jgi:hypothetical protein
MFYRFESHFGAFAAQQVRRFVPPNSLETQFENARPSVNSGVKGRDMN